MEVRKKDEKYRDYRRRAKASVVAESLGNCRPSLSPVGNGEGVDTQRIVSIGDTRMKKKR